MIIQANDKTLLTELLHKDGLWEDYMEEGSAQELDMSPSFWYLPILEGEEIAGIAVAQWLGNKLITWHFGLLKKFRNHNSPKYAKEAMKYINDKCSNVVHTLMLPSYKTYALAGAKETGFKEVYRIKKSILKNNELHDRILMELNGEE